MKHTSLLFLLAGALAVVSGAPQEQPSPSPSPSSSPSPSPTPSPSPSTSPVPIVRNAADGPNPDGSYSWSYESADGTKAEESGSLRQVEQRSADEGGSEALSAQGAFSFVAPDGTSYSVRYTADENGFRPEGAHLPVAPAVPEAIVRALKYIAEHPEEDNIDSDPEQKKN